MPLVGTCEHNMEKAIELKSHKKGYTFDQDKAIRPEETVRRALERINAYGHPLMKSFYKINHYFNMSMYRIDSSEYVRSRFPSFNGSNGKGAVDEQARASCVMEFLERFSSNKYSGWEKHKYTEFPADRIIPAESIANTLNYHSTDRDEVLEELRSVPMLWARAYNFAQKKYLYIPKIFFDVATTGLAAGNVFEEALLQAICECVERHCGACVQWYRQGYPTIDKSSIKSTLNIELIKKLEDRGMEVVIKDFSGILSIPTIGVILIDKEYRDDIGKSIGVCCDREKALVRALTESVQGIEKRTKVMFKNRSASYYFNTYKEVEFLFSGPVVNYEDVLDIGKDDIKEEVENCINILASKGKEVMYVDMTDSEIQVPAVWVYLKDAFLVYETKSLLFYLATNHLSNSDHKKIPEDIKNLKAAGIEDGELCFLFGFYYQKNGNYKEAIKYFNTALELHPIMKGMYDRKIILFHIGTCYLWLKEYDVAIKYLNNAKALDEKDGAVCRNLAVAYQQKKQFGEAAEYFEKAIQINPSDKNIGDLYFNAGLCYMELHQYEKSLENFEKAKVTVGNNWNLYYQLGVSYQRLGNYNEAVSNYQKCIEFDTTGHLDKSMVRFHLGECFLGLKEYDKAIEYLKMAGDKEEDRGVAFLKIGLCYEGKNNFKEAIPYYNKALELGTVDAKTKSIIYSQRARSYFAIEEYERALESFQKAKELNPDECITFFNLGVCYKKLGKYKEALENLEHAVKFKEHIAVEKQGEIYFHLGLCNAALENYETAIKIFYIAEPNIREKKDLYFHIGLCYHKHGKQREAINNMEKALKNKDTGGITDINILFYLGLSYNMLEEYDKAIEVLGRAITIGGSGMIKYHLGMSYQSLCRYKEAITSFEEAFEETSDDNIRGEIKYQIGYSKLEMGDKAGAKEALKEAVLRKPDRAEPYNLLGMLYIEESDNDKAIDVLKKGVDVSPRDWTNYNLLGVGFRNKGNIPEAIKALEKAIMLNPKEWRNYNILGKIYMNLNAYAQALYMYEKAMKLCEDENFKNNLNEKISIAETKIKEAGVQKNL